VLNELIKYVYAYDPGLLRQQVRVRSDQVRDFILIAKKLGLKYLLVMLHKQGFFPDWGFYMWSAAMAIDPDGLGRDWLQELVFFAIEHLESICFGRDGAQALTASGMKIFLSNDEMQCEEILVFQAVKDWINVRWRRIEDAYAKLQAEIDKRVQESKSLSIGVSQSDKVKKEEARQKQLLDLKPKINHKSVGIIDIVMLGTGGDFWYFDTLNRCFLFASHSFLPTRSTPR